MLLRNETACQTKILAKFLAKLIFVIECCETGLEARYALWTVLANLRHKEGERPMSEEQTKACLTSAIIAQRGAGLQNYIHTSVQTGGWLWRV